MEKSYDYSPKLNIAIPSPASDSMEIDFSIILGIATCHLQNQDEIQSVH